MALVFATPAPSGTGANRDKFRAELAELRARPGEWAIVRPAVNNNGFGRSFKLNGCEVTQRTRPDGLYDIYARWVEPVAQPATLSVSDQSQEETQ